MRIVLLGAPGSGKGTQSQKLQAKYGVPQVSSGDLLRDAVARGTELGLKAKAVMDSGQLVSDDIVLGLIRDRLSRPDAANGFILDGFPRNIDQANALQDLLADLGQPLEAVLLLEVERDSLVKRLAGRRVCPKCGTVYNVHSMAPGATGCAKDGAELQQRPDDKEEVVAKRLEVYEKQTRPLVEHYSKLGMLRVVAGEGELEDVFERMEAAALAAPVPAIAMSVKRAAPKKAGSTSKPKAKARAAVKSKATGKTSRKPAKRAAEQAQRVSASKSAKRSKPAAKARKKTARTTSKASPRSVSKSRTATTGRRASKPTAKKVSKNRRGAKARSKK